MFDHPFFDNHEQVVFAADVESGLKAIIAIHNTNRGPSLGGCRVWPYGSALEATTDALRLARGMTYKNALAELPLGGGKSVMMVPERGAQTPAMFEALGRTIEGLSGAYIAAEDVGSTPADMAAIRRHTQHVTGLAPQDGGIGDPSPTTAIGCFEGLKATARAALGREGVDGVHVAIQGLGHVGFALAQSLSRDGARLTVADIDAAAVERACDELGATPAPADTIHTVAADIFSPNALGASLNQATVPQLNVKAVAGGANNQLATETEGLTLHRRGILYAPDFAMNAGGVIKMAGEILKWNADEIEARARAIGPRLTDIFARAQAANRPPHEIAEGLARARFSARAVSSPPSAHRAG